MKKLNKKDIITDISIIFNYIEATVVQINMNYEGIIEKKLP